MTITSGIQASYTDPGSGITLPSAWLQIRQINYVAEVACLVVVDVYVNQAAYNSGLSPLFTNVLPQVNGGSSDFDTYFTVAVMEQAGHDILAQAVEYLNYKY